MKPISLLIVEDVPNCLDGVTSELRNLDISFDIASDMNGAGECLSRNHYSLLLLDIWLKDEKVDDPHISGLTILRALRGGQWGEPNHKIPVIVFTGYPELDIEDQVHDLGNAVMVAKPAARTKMVELIKGRIGEHVR